MKTVGIICEYNPFHLGHRKQIQTIRQDFGADAAIVCLMSGNFVQRGAPAIVDKSLRARAAIDCGADLVLELPVTCALSSAEGFAAGGVRILSPFCDALCFGAETADRQVLLLTARALLSEDFPPLLRQALSTGISFPAARQQALEQMGLPEAPLTRPNDILGVEYCKAILSQSRAMVPYPIVRGGDYHAQNPDRENPSASSLRSRMGTGQNWLEFVPEEARALFRDAKLHTTAAGERAMLLRLRSMTDGEFEALPYGSEGLWRRVMHACRDCGSYEQILAAAKSKRYTHTRLSRMLMCAFLGLTRTDLETEPPYARVLALSGRGREVLNTARIYRNLPNTGQTLDCPWQALENRCDDLYGLFAVGTPDPPGMTKKRRIYLNGTSKNAPFAI